MSITLLIGDCREKLRELPDASVHCCVTSPPYFGLRDYGTADWQGGDDSCDHLGKPHSTQSGFNERYFGKPSTVDKQGALREPFRDECGKCGAIRIDRQLGLESTPDEYVAGMVEVFREVRRVLRDDGTLWLNIGDSYSNTTTGNLGSKITLGGGQANQAAGYGRPDKSNLPGIKTKDLIGIPWMLAFALRADGWFLRQEIIWAKPNPMPESVRDRCTKAHEQIFLLSKSPRYYFDAEAIREGEQEYTRRGSGRPLGGVVGEGRQDRENFARDISTVGANKRSVWTVATQPFSEAHFATYPPALIEPCILAGCPERCCAKCGAPHISVIEATAPDGRKAILTSRGALDEDGRPLIGDNMIDHGVRGSFNAKNGVLSKQVIGAKPSCGCGAGTIAGTVLDPFAGAGTTGLVADRLSRNAILIELNAEYAALAERRMTDDAPLFTEVRAA